MALKFAKLAVGMTVFDVHRTKMGHVNSSELGCWKVQIIALALDGATVSWNNNPSKFMSIRQLEKLHINLPKNFRDQQARRAARVARVAKES